MENHNNTQETDLKPSFQQQETQLVDSNPDWIQKFSEKYRQFQEENEKLRQLFFNQMFESLDRYKIQSQEKQAQWEKEMKSFLESYHHRTVTVAPNQNPEKQEKDTLADKDQTEEDEQVVTEAEEQDEDEAMLDKFSVDKCIQTDIVAIKHLASEVLTPVITPNKETDTEIPSLNIDQTPNQKQKHQQKEEEEEEVDVAEPINNQPQQQQEEDDDTHKEVQKNDEQAQESPEEEHSKKSHLMTAPPVTPKRKISYFTDTKKRSSKKFLRKLTHGKKLSFREDSTQKDTLKKSKFNPSLKPLTLKFNDHSSSTDFPLTNPPSHLTFTSRLKRTKTHRCPHCSKSLYSADQLHIHIKQLHRQMTSPLQLDRRDHPPTSTANILTYDPSHSPQKSTHLQNGQHDKLIKHSLKSKRTKGTG